MPKIKKTEPWDGKDGQLPEEDDIDLDDVDLDDIDHVELWDGIFISFEKALVAQKLHSDLWSAFKSTLDTCNLNGYRETYNQSPCDSELCDDISSSLF